MKSQTKKGEVMAKNAPPGSRLMVVADNDAPETRVMKTKMDQRYAIDPASLKILKEAGRRAALRLFDMITKDETWENLNDRSRIVLLELALNRAYGKVETITVEEKALEQTKPEIAGALPHHLRALAGMISLPELQGAKAAKSSDEPSET